MTATLLAQTPLEPKKTWKWILVALLVLLLHIGILSLKTNWDAITAPPKVDVNTVDTKTLEQIKDRWQKRQMVLDDEKTSDKTPPKDARFFSGRNHSVEREQQARKRGIETPAQRHIPLARLALPLDSPMTDSTRPQPDRAQPKEGHEFEAQDLRMKDLPEGAENLLNTRESVFYSFYARMYRTMGPIFRYNSSHILWLKNIQPGEYIAVVEGVLDGDGKLVRLEWHQRSGLKEFDESVEKTWTMAGQFHNPPKMLIGPDGYVRVPFSFAITISRN